MSDYSMEIELFNATVEEIGNLSYIVRDNDLQRKALAELSTLAAKVENWKRRAVSKQDEHYANVFLGGECVIEALQAELNMWLQLKEGNPDDAWNSLAVAQKATRDAIRASRGFSHLEARAVRLVDIERVVFPGQMFLSAGLIVRRQQCSICGAEYEDCPHIVGMPYMGEFCRCIVDPVSRAIVDTKLANAGARIIFEKGPRRGKLLVAETFKPLNRDGAFMIEASVSHSAVYNALPDVMEADQTLTSVGREDVLRRLSTVLVHHRLHDDIGIRLLHKHNDVERHELMIEREEVEGEDDFRLTTVASLVPEVEEYLSANSWILIGSEAVALEFSLDRIVAEKSEKLTGSASFLAEFQQVLDELGVAGLLGLCVVDRVFYTERKPIDGRRKYLIETSDEARRANVVKFRARSGDGPLIDTVWQAREFVVPPDVTMGCSTETTTKPVCVPIAVIHCEATAGGHQRTTTNEHQRSTETTTVHTFIP